MRFAVLLGASLGDDILLAAGETAEEIHDRKLNALGHGRTGQKEAKSHVASQRPRSVLVDVLKPALALVATNPLERFGHQKWITERMLLPSCIRSKA